MPAPAEIIELVQRFELHRESYKSPGYNETQLRREFVDPFFKALGWDVDNLQGYAEAYKDVIHEDAIKIGGTTKAPDYCFRIGGQRKFFVETKKPFVNIGKDISPAFQLRRYAWTAKLPLSILTDFEELAVYDCLIHKPVKTDKASKARTLYLKYTEYADRWDEIASIFAREAILKGSFDKYAETYKKKRGTAEVDDEFLKEIESWRVLLARNLALRNPKLSQRELNFAVQRTIDRIIFLRICEDRGVERSARLQALLNGPTVYPRLCELFQRADDRYNSGLFHFHKEKDRPEEPDNLTLSLKIDDKPLKQIIKNLYYPDCPYEFSVFPADILGQVYEQFLGKVIRLTAGHQAKIEEKPEVKKAGGVYYTPTYIVEYIVEQTVGKLLEGKTPQEIGGLTKTWKPSKSKQPLTVLDPACGSGSFLIGAYQKLLDWHRDWYVDAGPKKHKERIYQTKSDEWRLTTAERKRILLSHIHGVDIDPQAVEVTKLSLLLKVLEGENQETLNHQLKMFQERALPDLASNIKCGNSLIGPDFYDGQQTLFDEEEALRINAFDWRAEFAEIMRCGGFDIVIGNPPYVRMEMFKDIKQYLRTHFACHAERSDLYAYFIEKEHALLAPDGLFGMIVSNKFIRAKYGEPLRGHLETAAKIERIVDLAGLPVFHGATVRTIVLITSSGRKNEKTQPAIYSPPPHKDELLRVEAGSCSLAAIADPIAYQVPAQEFSKSGWRVIRPEYAQLMDGLSAKGTTLKDFMDGKICRGIVSGLTDAFVIGREKREEIVSTNAEADNIIRRFLRGKQIRRFEIEPTDEFLIYTHHGIDMAPYPAVIEHLNPFRSRLEKRATKQHWYELQQPQFAYVDFLEQHKIVFPDIATGCRFALDTGGHFGANTVYFLPTANLQLLGVLNSRLAFFFFQQTCAALEGPSEAYLRFFGQYLEGFPVCLPKTEHPMHDQLAQLVEQAESLREKLKAATTNHKRTIFQRQIETTDRKIDQLVYELYGLTDEEIQVVEEPTIS